MLAGLAFGRRRSRAWRLHRRRPRPACPPAGRAGKRSTAAAAPHIGRSIMDLDRRPHPGGDIDEVDDRVGRMLVLRRQRGRAVERHDRADPGHRQRQPHRADAAAAKADRAHRAAAHRRRPRSQASAPCTSCCSSWKALSVRNRRAPRPSSRNTAPSPRASGSSGTAPARRTPPRQLVGDPAGPVRQAELAVHHHHRRMPPPRRGRRQPGGEWPTGVGTRTSRPAPAASAVEGSSATAPVASAPAMNSRRPGAAAFVS